MNEENLESLVDRLRGEQRARWLDGDPVLSEIYFDLYPQLLVHSESALELLYNEIMLREEKEQQPSLNDFLRRFPQFASQLEILFEVHQVLESDQLLDTKDLGIGPVVTGGERESATTGSWPRISGYELLAELGRGGMGVVYKARHVSLNRIVALKMILPGNQTGPVHLARFRAEAEAVARLRHPNIVQVYDVGEQDGRPYFSLEFIDGGTLAQTVNGTPQPARAAARLVQTLSRAIHTAHQQRIIHRDLKPANILMSREWELGKEEQDTIADGAYEVALGSALFTPKITDFGLAKQIGAEVAQTCSGAVLGTASYMAPEQAEGKQKNIGPMVDVYALGAILYELLAGRPPFKAETQLDTLRLVLSEEPVSLSRLHLKVPRDLETICLKCLHKEAHKRYGSAHSLAEDLERFLNDRPIRARRTTALERTWRWGRRNSALTFLTVLAAAALLAAIGVTASFGFYQYRATANLQAALRDAQTQRQQADVLSAHLAFDQAIRLCEQQEVGKGMLWLARSLEIATRAEDVRLQRDIRTNLNGWRGHLHNLEQYLRHGDSVLAAAFSPDGNSILTGSGDHKAQLWAVATGKPLLQPFEHRDGVLAVAISPDGRLALTGSADRCARIWSLKTGDPVGEPMRHRSSVGTVAFSPDGRLALTGSEDCTAQLWEAATGNRHGPAFQHDGPVNSVAFSPNGRTVLTSSDDKTARLWDVANCLPLGTPFRHRGPVEDAVFSPDGRSILTGSDDHTAQLWEAATGQRLAVPLEHRDRVGTVAFSPDGKMVVTGSCDRTARIWEAATGKPIGLPLKHGDWLRFVSFSPDSQKVVTASYDRTACIWEASTGAILGNPLPNRGWVIRAIFSPDSKTLITASGDGVRVWRMGNNLAPQKTFDHRSPVRAAIFSAENTRILTLGGSNEAKLWDAATGSLIGKPLGQADTIRVGAFSADGKAVATAGADCTARLWNVATGEGFGAAMRHQDAIVAITFSPDGKSVLTGSQDGTARLWDSTSGAPLGSAMHHEGEVTAVGFSPDGKILVTASLDGTSRLWDAATGRMIGPKLQHAGHVFAAGFSADGLKVVTASNDGSARIWDALTGKLIGKPLLHQGSVGAARFSPDNHWVLTSSSDKTARVWNTLTCEPASAPLSHLDEARALDWNPDGSLVATSSRDKTARLWDPITGKPMGPPIQHRGVVWSVQFSSDGRSILTASEDGTARLQPVPSQLEGGVEQISLWARVLTGMELGPDESIRVLDFPSWQEYQDRLAQLGGRPYRR